MCMLFLSGPFQLQSATWKNLAVSYLTVPNALKKKKNLIGGLKSLCTFLKHKSKEVDKVTTNFLKPHSARYYISFCVYV